MQNTGYTSKIPLDLCQGQIVTGLTVYGWSLVGGTVLTAFTSYSLMWVGVHCNRRCKTSSDSDDTNVEIDPYSAPQQLLSINDDMAQDAEGVAATPTAMAISTSTPPACWRNCCRDLVVCCNCIATADNDLVYVAHQQQSGLDEVEPARTPSEGDEFPASLSPEFSKREAFVSVLEIDDRDEVDFATAKGTDFSGFNYDCDSNNIH